MQNDRRGDHGTDDGMDRYYAYAAAVSFFFLPLFLIRPVDINLKKLLHLEMVDNT
jgi:hypothetical protein